MTFDEFIKQTLGNVSQQSTYVPPVPGGTGRVSSPYATTYTGNLNNFNYDVNGTTTPGTGTLLPSLGGAAPVPGTGAVANPYATEYTGPPPEPYVAPTLGNLPPIPGAGAIGEPYATTYTGPPIPTEGAINPPPLGNLPPIPGAGAIDQPYATEYTGPAIPGSITPILGNLPPVPGAGAINQPYAQNPTGPPVVADNGTILGSEPGLIGTTPPATPPPAGGTPGAIGPGGVGTPGAVGPGGAFTFGGGTRFDPYSGANAAQFAAGGQFDPATEAGKQQLNANPLLAAQVAAFQRYGAFNQLGDEFKRFVLDNLNRAASNASLQARLAAMNNAPADQMNVFGQMQGDLTSGNFFSPAASRGLFQQLVNVANNPNPQNPGTQAAIDYLTDDNNRRAILNYALQGMNRIDPYYDYVLRNQSDLQNMAGGGQGAWLEFLRTRGLV